MQTGTAVQIEDSGYDVTCEASPNLPGSAPPWDQSDVRCSPSGRPNRAPASDATKERARWSHITKALISQFDVHRSISRTENTGSLEHLYTLRRRRATGFSHVSMAALVKVIERPSAKFAVICWQDATQCHYGDQMWQRSRADSAGVCAISGHVIQRGDWIFRPRMGARPPLNAHAMILACSLDEGSPDAV